MDPAFRSLSNRVMACCRFSRYSGFSVLQNTLIDGSHAPALHPQAACHVNGFAAALGGLRHQPRGGHADHRQQGDGGNHAAQPQTAGSSAVSSTQNGSHNFSRLKKQRFPPFKGNTLLLPACRVKGYTSSSRTAHSQAGTRKKYIYKQHVFKYHSYHQSGTQPAFRVPRPSGNTPVQQRKKHTDIFLSESIWLRGG